MQWGKSVVTVILKNAEDRVITAPVDTACPHCKNKDVNKTGERWFWATEEDVDSYIFTCRVCEREYRL
jgi:hypothetical protein